MHMFVVTDKHHEAPDEAFDRIEDARLKLTERCSQGFAAYLIVDEDRAHSPERYLDIV